jgi:hypothetical protein
VKTKKFTGLWEGITQGIPLKTGKNQFFARELDPAHIRDLGVP